MRKHIPGMKILLSSVGMLILILDTKTALHGAVEGISLCIQTVIPSLFPFFLLSILLTDALAGISIPGLRWLNPMLRIRPGSEGILLTGLLGGYPSGAQSIATSCQAGQLSASEGNRMLSFCVNAGPAFIFGMGIQLLGSSELCWLSWIIHIASALLTARLTPGSFTGIADTPKKPKRSMASALKQAIWSMASVCGWVILFRVLLCFAQRWFLWAFSPFLQQIFCGLLEMTNGCLGLQAFPISQKFALFSLFLGFGGICVLMQVSSLLDGTALSVKHYVWGKLCQGCVAFLICQIVSCFLWEIPSVRLWLTPLACLAALMIYRYLPEKLQKSSSISPEYGV